MRQRTPRYGLVLAAILGSLPLLGLPVRAADVEDANPLSPTEVRARWQSRLDRYQFVAEVSMRMEAPGLAETRRMDIFRDDVDGAAERVLVRFTEPPDLRRVAFLYLEHHARPNDYFLYLPAVQRVRRLPGGISDVDVYGIDLEFLGFGVAETYPTEIREMDRAEIRGEPVYRLVELAQAENPRFSRKVTWVHAETFVPLRTEHYMGDRLVLIAETTVVEAVQGVLTPKTMRFERPTERMTITIKVESIDYLRDLPDEVFSALSMTRARSPME